MCGDEESRSLLGNHASPALFCIVLGRWSAGDGEYSLVLMASKACGVVGYNCLPLLFCKVLLLVSCVLGDRGIMRTVRRMSRFCMAYYTLLHGITSSIF